MHLAEFFDQELIESLFTQEAQEALCSRDMFDFESLEKANKVAHDDLEFDSWEDYEDRLDLEEFHDKHALKPDEGWVEKNSTNFFEVHV